MFSQLPVLFRNICDYYDARKPKERMPLQLEGALGTKEIGLGHRCKRFILHILKAFWKAEASS